MSHGNSDGLSQVTGYETTKFADANLIRFKEFSTGDYTKFPVLSTDSVVELTTDNTPAYVGIYIPQEYVDNCDGEDLCNDTVGWYIFQRDNIVNGLVDYMVPVAWPTGANEDTGYLGWYDLNVPDTVKYGCTFLDSYVGAEGSGGTDIWTAPSLGFIPEPPTSTFTLEFTDIVGCQTTWCEDNVIENGGFDIMARIEGGIASKIIIQFQDTSGTEAATFLSQLNPDSSTTTWNISGDELLYVGHYGEADPELPGTFGVSNSTGKVEVSFIFSEGSVPASPGTATLEIEANAAVSLLKAGDGFNGRFIKPDTSDEENTFSYTSTRADSLDYNPIGNTSDKGFSAAAIFRFTELPEITREDDFYVTAQAYHIEGIKKVTFIMDGGTPIDAWEPVPHPNDLGTDYDNTPSGLGKDFKEYMVRVDTSNMTNDTVHEIRAIAWPNKGYPVVLQGERSRYRYIRSSDNVEVDAIFDSNPTRVYNTMEDNGAPGYTPGDVEFGRINMHDYPWIPGKYPKYHPLEGQPITIDRPILGTNGSSHGGATVANPYQGTTMWIASCVDSVMAGYHGFWFRYQTIGTDVALSDYNPSDHGRRIAYVNNSAAAGGDGSSDSPYNNISEACTIEGAALYSGKIYLMGGTHQQWTSSHSGAGDYFNNSDDVPSLGGDSEASQCPSCKVLTIEGDPASTTGVTLLPPGTIWITDRTQKSNLVSVHYKNFDLVMGLKREGNPYITSFSTQQTNNPTSVKNSIFGSSVMVENINFDSSWYDGYGGMNLVFHAYPGFIMASDEYRFPNIYDPLLPPHPDGSCNPLADPAGRCDGESPYPECLCYDPRDKTYDTLSPIYSPAQYGGSDEEREITGTDEINSIPGDCTIGETDHNQDEGGFHCTGCKITGSSSKKFKKVTLIKNFLESGCLNDTSTSICSCITNVVVDKRSSMYIAGRKVSQTTNTSHADIFQSNSDIHAWQDNRIFNNMILPNNRTQLFHIASGYQLRGGPGDDARYTEGRGGDYYSLFHQIRGWAITNLICDIPDHNSTNDAGNLSGSFDHLYMEGCRLKNSYINPQQTTSFGITYAGENYDSRSKRMFYGNMHTSKINWQISGIFNDSNKAIDKFNTFPVFDADPVGGVTNENYGYIKRITSLNDPYNDQKQWFPIFNEDGDNIIDNPDLIINSTFDREAGDIGTCRYFSNAVDIKTSIIDTDTNIVQHESSSAVVYNPEHPSGHENWKIWGEGGIPTLPVAYSKDHDGKDLASFGAAIGFTSDGSTKIGPDDLFYLPSFTQGINAITYHDGITAPTGTEQQDYDYNKYGSMQIGWPAPDGSGPIVNDGNDQSIFPLVGMYYYDYKDFLSAIKHGGFDYTLPDGAP